MKKIDKSFLFVSFLIIFIYITCMIFTGEGLPCMFYKITGLYCPGCGITRLIISLFHFDLYQAFRFNPLIFILLCCGIIYIFLCLIKQKIINIPNYVYITLLITFIIFGIMRNIPLFSFLLPTVVN